MNYSYVESSENNIHFKNFKILKYIQDEKAYVIFLIPCKNTYEYVKRLMISN